MKKKHNKPSIHINMRKAILLLTKGVLIPCFITLFLPINMVLLVATPVEYALTGDVKQVTSVYYQEKREFDALYYMSLTQL